MARARTTHKRKRKHSSSAGRHCPICKGPHKVGSHKKHRVASHMAKNPHHKGKHRVRGHLAELPSTHHHSPTHKGRRHKTHKGPRTAAQKAATARMIAANRRGYKGPPRRKVRRRVVTRRR